ncbi:MAG: aldehyde dehydrogenase (NADP(+)) [Deltaproteobacteria bacterium]|nr:aldehyde dehydrogenase (NADP(+)) [Deltaproteobacteria bacterium]
MEIHGDHFIAGQRLAGQGESFTAIDPRDGTTLPGAFFDATTEQTDRAMESAVEAHEQWRRSSREDRAALLEAIATGIEGLGDALIERASAETGLPPARFVGERGRTMGQLRMFAGVVRDGAYLDVRIGTALPDRTPLPRPDLRRMLVPVGPVVVFGASNFPLAFSVAGGDTASALAAGCPVVTKAHPAHPGTSELVAHAVNEAIARVGAPAAVFSCLHGRGHAVGQRLVGHPHTRAVGFTGSLAGGRALHGLAARRPDPIPVFAEMGSINPVVLLPHAVAANPEGLADALFGSMTLGVGQFCTNPGLVLAVAGEATERFLARLSSLTEAAAPVAMLHDGIAQGFATSARRLDTAGAERIAGPSDVREGHAGVRPVVWRVSAASLPGDRRLHEECFGPSTLVAVADDVEQLRAAATALPGQLTATVHAADDDAAAVEGLLPVLEERAGRVLFGGFPTGVEVSSAMHHGGPWPATSDARFTSVGTAAIQRFCRPVCWQDTPSTYLPPELHDDNPTAIVRSVDGQLVVP